MPKTGLQSTVPTLGDPGLTREVLLAPEQWLAGSSESRRWSHKTCLALGPSVRERFPPPFWFRQERGKAFPKRFGDLWQTRTGARAPSEASWTWVKLETQTEPRPLKGATLRDLTRWTPRGVPKVVQVDSDLRKGRGSPRNRKVAVTPSVLLRSTRSQSLLGALDQEHTMAKAALFSGLRAPARDLSKFPSCRSRAHDTPVDGPEDVYGV